jgi:hypothetical protein
VLAGLEQRLVAHHGQAAHVFALVVGVDHHPVPGHQLAVTSPVLRMVTV